MSERGRKKGEEMDGRLSGRRRREKKRGRMDQKKGKERCQLEGGKDGNGKLS